MFKICSFFYPSSNFEGFQYFSMKIFVKSDLILKRWFPRSFVDKFIFSTSIISIIETVSHSGKLWRCVRHLLSLWANNKYCIISQLEYHGFFQSTTDSMENIGVLKMNLSTKDPGNQRFRMRSDFTKKIMGKILKNLKVRARTKKTNIFWTFRYPP